MFKFRKLTSKLTILAILAMMIPQSAFAASLVNAQLKLSTNKVSTDHSGNETNANHTYTFQLGTALAAGETMTITASDFAIPAALDYEDMDLAVGDNTCENSPSYTDKTLAAAASGSTWGAVRTSSTVITLTSGTDTISTGLCIQIEVGTNADSGSTGAEQIANPTSTGATQITVASTSDSAVIAAAIVTDPQVDVTAYINPTLTLAIDDIAIDDLTALSSSSTVTNSDATVTVTTNAGDGYILKYYATALSNQNGDTIDPQGTEATQASGVGTAKWGFNIDGGSHADGTVNANYTDGSGASYMAVVGSETLVASSSAGATSDAYDVELAYNIAATTPAGLYTNTIDFMVYAQF